ncbi:MAG: hypothetical protein OXC53_08970, partial [Rhodobacteraceae bacterium]|nr:hypothetical protein [Paracoccaceae bacterium]
MKRVKGEPVRIDRHDASKTAAVPAHVFSAVISVDELFAKIFFRKLFGSLWGASWPCPVICLLLVATTHTIESCPAPKDHAPSAKNGRDDVPAAWVFQKIPDPVASCGITVMDCLMADVAMFHFTYPSLLCFDPEMRGER